jgi:cation diffusion facilitator CzcD-associated flavoprotein CzcO
MRVAIVGAGPAGLAAARAFRELGQDVVVFEAAPDIGGVWSATRRYPGISTQSDRRSYTYSDGPMEGVPDEGATGAEVRSYLQAFARDKGLDSLIRLRTRVAAAEPIEGGWAFETHGPGGVGRETADWLVVANGLSCKPYVPSFPGRAAFEVAGGSVLSPSDLGDGEALHDRDVVVVGWGKSAADIAAVAAPVARSVTVVARRIEWKVPRRIGPFSYQTVMLSRLGEHLIWGPHRTSRGRVARRLGRPLRVRLVRRLGEHMVQQLELERRGLVPDVPADQLGHLLTEGFLEAVDGERIVVRRATRIARLDGDGGPAAILDDGTVLPAHVVVAATGYDQDLDLFTDAARRTLVDEQGDLVLLRHALPESLPNLAFVGWVNTWHTLIGAEAQSLWVAAVALGLLEVPEKARRRPQVYRLAHERAAARGVPQLPEAGSFPTVDTWLTDLGLMPSVWRRRRELLGPMDPAAYAPLLGRLRARQADLAPRRRVTPPSTRPPAADPFSATRPQAEQDVLAPHRPALTAAPPSNPVRTDARTTKGPCAGRAPAEAGAAQHADGRRPRRHGDVRRADQRGVDRPVLGAPQRVAPTARRGGTSGDARRRA